MNTEEPLIDAVLRRYPTVYQPERIELRGNAGGFSGATIVRLETPVGPFCLRQWPEVSPPPERIRGLHRLLGHIHREGVRQVAIPVATRDGATLVTVAGRYWQLEPWLPGQADYRDHPSPTKLRAVMACLVQWHHAAARFLPTGAEAQWFHCARNVPSPAVIERLEQLRQCDQQRAVLRQRIGSSPDAELRRLADSMLQLFERSASRIAAELNLAARLRLAVQPCLRDVWHDHVLFTNETVTGLIDPSACRSENVAADLARLLGSLLGDDRSAWDAALAEYQRRRPLSPDELALIPVLDRSGTLLSGLTWLRWLFVEGRTFADRGRVLARLEGVRARMELL